MDANEFIKTLASVASSVGRKAATRPGMAAATGVAAVASPLMLKNDQRGYLQTAAITTPAIISAAMVAPRLMPVFRSEGRRLADVARNVPADYGFTTNQAIDLTTATPDAIEAAFQSGRLGISEKNRRLADFYSGLVIKSSNTRGDIDREFGSLTTNFMHLYDDPSKRRLLENALYHAQLKGSGAADKLKFGSDLRAVAPSYSADEMSYLIDANHDNIDWIREMNFRMRQASGARMAGADDVVPQIADLKGTANHSYASWNEYSGRGRAILEDARPDLVKQMDALLADKAAVKQWGYKAEDIAVFTLPQANQPYGKIVGLGVGKDVMIPVIDANGGVRLGSQFEHQGVSRFFMTHDADVAADVYGIQNLIHGPQFVKSELTRAQFIVGRDPLNQNPFSVTESGTVQATLNQQKFYSQQGVFSNAPNAFAPMDGDGGIWDKMRAERKVQEISHQVTHGGKIRTTGGTKIETLERAETRLIEPGGMQNRSKESLRIKSMNKSVWASVDPSARGFSHTTYADLPEFATRTLQITPSQRAIFGDLPEWNQIAGDADDMWNVMNGVGFESRQMAQEARVLSMDVALNRMGHKQRSINYIMRDAGVNETQATDMWNRLLTSIGGSDAREMRANYNALRNIGYVGEGARIMNKDIGAVAMRHSNYLVTENSLAERLLKGGSFGADQTLGMNMGVPMFAQGEDNRILGYSVNDLDGSMVLSVEERFGVQGMKGHNLTKWTVGRALEDDEMGRIRNMFNAYYGITGQGGRVADEVNSVALQQFNSEKANNPLQILNDALGDTLRRITAAKADTSFLVSTEGKRVSYLDELSSHGYDFRDGQLITDVDRIANINAAPAEYQSASDTIRRLMDDVGARIKAHQIEGDAFMQSYIDWSLNRQKNSSYLDYLVERALPESVSISDHMALNHAERVGITRDALQQLGLMGEHDLARELVNRIEPDGSTGMTLDFIQHTDPSSRDLSKAFGASSIEFDEAFRGGFDSHLGSAKGRVHEAAGEVVSNIFDPANPLTQKNYSIHAKVNGQDLNIPVLGREAYGGKANAHGLMEYSANKWEGELRTLMNAIGKGESHEEALDAYLTAVRGNFGAGKESIWRAPNVDPLGFEGRATARASSLRYEDGSVNPFEIGVGKEYLELMPKEQADVLREGGRLQAIALRHPINATPMTYLKYDPNLNGSWQIGADPVLQRMMRMDADGDRVSFHLANSSWLKGDTPLSAEEVAGLTGENAARYRRWQHIHGEITDPLSLQGSISSFRRVFEGDELNPREYTKGAFTDVFRQIGDFASKDTLKSIKARTAAADVGMLSNTFDLLETSLLHNDLIKDPLERMTAHEFGYDVVREASIAAQKLKGGGAYQDLQTLMGWNNSIRSALNDRSEGGMRRFVSAMTEGAKNFGKYIDVNDAHRSFFDMDKVELVDGKINPYYEYARQTEVLEKQWRGHNTDITQLQSILAASQEKAADYAKKDLVSLFNGYVPSANSYARRGSAWQVAEAIGAENAATADGVATKARRAATGVADQAMRAADEVVHAARGTGALKTLGVGVAVAAGAGLLFGSLRSPRSGQALAPSANAHRPEERVGVDGHAAGDPESGSLAPANPPRRVRPAQEGVRTAIVAPIRRTTDLEVHMKADDQGRAAEVSKLASRLAAPSGNSNVSITYRDRTRLNSLRTKTRIREAMDES